VEVLLTAWRANVQKRDLDGSVSVVDDFEHVRRTRSRNRCDDDAGRK
jgi:hypothetical protein